MLDIKTKERVRVRGIEKMLKAIRRLWRFATCEHKGCSSHCVEFKDTYKLVFCRACGRILSFTSEGERVHNPYWDYDQTGDHLDNIGKG